MLGESLGIITEKRIADLEEELNELRSTWVDPETNQALRDKLAESLQMKEKFEVITNNASDIVGIGGGVKYYSFMKTISRTVMICLFLFPLVWPT